MALATLIGGPREAAAQALAPSAPQRAPNSERRTVPAAGSANLIWLDAENRPLSDADAVLGISKAITHDRSLPRSLEPATISTDPANFRLELQAPEERAPVVYAQLESIDERGVRHGVLRHVPLVPTGQPGRFRSPFLRLVADETDLSAPDVAFQLLRARLRDRVVVRLGGSAQSLSAQRFVGRAGTGERRDDVLRGRLRLLVLRSAPGSPTVLGESDVDAVELARRQIEIANEIWAQCFIDFGTPERSEVRAVDPPPPALLAIADLDGLPAAGNGKVSFRAGGQRVGPVPLRAGALPEETALDIARLLRARGFLPSVSVNPRTDHGAHASANLVVRDAKHQLVPLSVDPELPLCSDSRQRVSIGSVDLSDGVSEFDNTISAVGTLEERTLVKLLSDEDPSTIDILLVNRFVHRDRQGEAFIEADGSSMANTLIFDRNAVRFERQAWVQAHELGHVLLDEPLHPDNVGPDRPWLLMDADARQGRVGGPKRLTEEECAKVRRRSGPGAQPALLKAIDP
ncbi:MAG TPA: hypothetical protein VFZ61_15280 [Polyangiales bacterium]